jgi:hypothetical protein
MDTLLWRRRKSCRPGQACREATWAGSEREETLHHGPARQGVNGGNLDGVSDARRHGRRTYHVAEGRSAATPAGSQ